MTVFTFASFCNLLLFIYHNIYREYFVGLFSIFCHFIYGYNKHRYNTLLNSFYRVSFTGDTFDTSIKPTTKSVLVNHNTWADYFVDNIILNNNGCYLSRYLVFLAMPFSALNSLLTRQVYFFNRSATNRNKTNSNKRNEFVHTICNKWNKIMIVYPEGTRNITGKPFPLKYGIIKELYLQQCPLQIMNVSNKTNIFNEKTLATTIGITCNVIISNQFDPKIYDSLDTFITDITTEFIRIYQ